MSETKQLIKCPDCGTIQMATVEHGQIFDTYLHNCDKCNFTIMESDWEVVNQTAVEWLLSQIESKNGKEFASYYSEFIEQAKAMEKEQIHNAFVAGDERCTKDIPFNCEQYYSQTYKLTT